jgi:hypothetical protein
MCTSWGTQDIPKEISFGSFPKNSLLEDGEGDESIEVKMYLRDVGWKDAK